MTKKSKQLLRREKILSMFEESQEISTEAFAKYFNVSAYTIRRDLNELVSQNKLKRFHGGAKATSETGLHKKLGKLALVEKVLPNIFDGCHIYIESPYVVEPLAELLPNINITVLTNDINFYQLVKNKDKIKMFFFGSDFGCGENKINFAHYVPDNILDSIDVAIVEAEYIDRKGYVLSECISKATLNRLALLQADRSYLVKSADKGSASRVCMHKVCTIDNVDYIFEAA